MPSKLKNLVITKVALVDEGSCSAAHIKLYKRKEGGQDMTLEEILKSLSPEQQAVVKAAMEAEKVAGEKAGKAPFAQLQADKEKLDEENKKLEKAKTDLEAEVAKLRNPESKSEDEVLKSVDPAIRALIEKSRNEAAAANAAILKMKDEADQAEALAKAKELSNLGADEATLVKSLKVLKNKDTECYTNVLNILKAANTKLSEGLNLDGVGSSVNKGVNVDVTKAADVAWVAVEKAADEISKARKCTKEAAITAVISEQPDLYNAYLNALQ